MSISRLVIGNTNTSGFVNFVQGNRLVVGTGSYEDRNGERVFKESITVFLHEKFDGVTPVKGDYIEVSGDLVISPRKDDPNQLNSTFNIRFSNQLIVKDAPQRAEATSTADEDDI